MTWSSSGTISWCVSKFWPWLSHQARRHADERHARLDQPAGDQRLLAELGRAVPVADLLRLARDVEERLAGHQAADPLVGLVVAAERTGDRPAAGEPLAQQVAQLGRAGRGRGRRCSSRRRMFSGIMLVVSSIGA